MDPRTLVCLAGIRNGISHEIKTTWATTYTRLGHNMFFIEDIVRQISINELGGRDGIKDFLEYMEMAPDGAKAAKIHD